VQGRPLSFRAVSDAAPDTHPTFDVLIGMVDVRPQDDGSILASVPVKPELKQPFGLVHGGVYASIAESLASMGTYAGVYEEGMHAMGLSNSTSFLRPILDGTIHATARPFHRGRTTWLWDVEIRDDDGRLCATTRMTIAVRPAKQ
jgi:1,4-dihydroxy-2-naphthoyl-CoA hydrolase